MIRVVLDANVWISSVLKAESIPGVIVAATRSGRFQPIVSTQLIDQVLRHLSRLGFSVGKVNDTYITMTDDSLLIEPQKKLDVIVGKDLDNRVLECAVEGQADYIVTGGKKHLLPLGTFQGIRIVSPRDFLAVIDLSDR
jgi:putative PIN family toxin of toxin-antitoxin system